MNSADVDGTKNAHNETRVKRGTDSSLTLWQRRLLPLMIVVLTTLATFFFVASIIQVYQIENRIQQNPQLDLEPTLKKLDYSNPKTTDETKLNFVKWETLSTLEASALRNRYHQANVLLITRIWVKYLGFVTGMILAFVGAVFILGKLKEDKAKIDASSNALKFSITTASPGLLLALFGTILMLTTMLTNYPINVTDTPLYISENSIISTEALSEPADAQATEGQPNVNQSENTSSNNSNNGNVVSKGKRRIRAATRPTPVTEAQARQQANSNNANKLRTSRRRRSDEESRGRGSSGVNGNDNGP
jgi:hypothetical protein